MNPQDFYLAVCSWLAFLSGLFFGSWGSAIYWKMRTREIEDALERTLDSAEIVAAQRDEVFRELIEVTTKPGQTVRFTQYDLKMPSDN